MRGNNDTGTLTSNTNPMIQRLCALLYPCLLLLALSSGTTLHGQNKYAFPFRLTADNNLVVRAVLNRVDTVNLMLHTAASAIAITEEAAARLKSLRFTAADSSVKSWGGDKNISRFSAGNTLQLGSLKWDNLPLWEDKQSGPGTDGKIGLDLFENKVVELDFDRGELVVYDRLPEKAKGYTRMPLRKDGTMLFLEAFCDDGSKTYSNSFLIHSGYAGAVLLDDLFVRKTGIAGKLKVLSEQKLTDAYGHVLKVKKAVLPELNIGGMKLRQVPAGFFEGAIGRQQMSIIGGDVLKRFHIIIDAERAYIYLKPDSLWEALYQSGK